MDNTAKMKNILVCPIHQCELQLDEKVHLWDGVPLANNKICCPQGCIFPIEKGIPRFVSPDNYSSSFGLQWLRYQKTQLDSYTGHKISRRRLEQSLNVPLERLKGKVVLEVGCGAGRFTEHLIDNCEFLVSMDFSNAVDANLKNCCSKNPYLLVQADINASPFPCRFFDYIICLGVIQHTPFPEQTIASLVEHLKPGGLLAIDHYTYRNRFSGLSEVFSLAYPLRAILKRLSPELGLKATIMLTAICDPIRKHTCKIKQLDRIARRFFPSICYYNTYPQLEPKIIYEWNELDTHDYLTDYYKHYRSLEDIRSCLEHLGLVDISCNIGGNGVVARATKK